MERLKGFSEFFCLKMGWRCGKNKSPSVTPCWIPCSKTISLLCDAGVGIGKTYAYLTACILLKKFAPHGPAGSQPVVISTSSVALQDAIIGEYIPFLSRIFLENRIISKAHPGNGKKRKGTFCLRRPAFSTIGSSQR